MAEEKMNGAEGIRINKFLSQSGACSRRGADALIEQGRVTVNGKKAESGLQVYPGDTVLLDGKPVQKEEEEILLLYHKPRGIVCSTVSQRGEENVVEHLAYPVRIYPIGRLDKDSEGLLLMTNQGDLVNRIMRAGNYHEKEYEVTVDKPITDAFIKRMSEGVPILDTVTRPCRVWQTSERGFRIILTQGLNRQIRRMCDYLGYHVKRLKRIRIMNLTLDGLERDALRPITAKEREQLDRLLAHSDSAPAAGYREKNTTRPGPGKRADGSGRERGGREQWKSIRKSNR